MNKRLLIVALGLSALLGACTPADDRYDYIEPSVVTITASPLTAEVGEAVTVTLEANLALDARSSVETRSITDIALGVCFGDDNHIPADIDNLVTTDGFCNLEKGVLPERYKLLEGTDSYKAFDDVEIQRGEVHEFRHEFTFTFTEAGRVILGPNMTYWDRGFEGPDSSGNIPPEYPIVTFE